jgi:hypothetical protein
MGIAHTRAAQDPANAEWQRDLLVPNGKSRDGQVEQWDLTGAMGIYRADMAIGKTLAGQNNVSLQAQLNLASSHYRTTIVSLDPRPGPESAFEILRWRHGDDRLPPENANWMEHVEAELANLPKEP